jgi:RimJ/RimL family protein N-acetyltransferase
VSTTATAPPPDTSFADRSELGLRPVRLEDWPVIHEWSRLPDIPRHQPWGPNRALQTRDFVVAAIAAANDSPRIRHVLSAVIANRVVGLAEVTVTAFHQGRPDRAEMGYAVHPAMRRQGVGTEIASLALDHAFGELGVHRVQATCDPLNTGSVRILESLGFVREGTIREDVRLAHRWRNSHVFGLLEDEWPGSQR